METEKKSISQETTHHGMAVCISGSSSATSMSVKNSSLFIINHYLSPIASAMVDNAIKVRLIDDLSISAAGKVLTDDFAQLAKLVGSALLAAEAKCVAAVFALGKILK